MKTATGRTIRVNDFVGFKDYVEKAGKVIGFAGEYVDIEFLNKETFKTNSILIHHLNVWYEDKPS